MAKNELSRRAARCIKPIPKKDVIGGDLIPNEESASLWMWAWPRLLGWSKTINWLFSPVTGKARYPGDLWGLDSQGDLIVVETKLARSSQRVDPFIDFVPYSVGPQIHDLCTSEVLFAKWEKLLESEYGFLKRYAGLFTKRKPSSGTYPGVLPYSSHRTAIWRWLPLYRERIIPLFRDGKYERAVRRSLSVREKRSNPSPIFVGLVATARPDVPCLKDDGKSFKELRHKVGADRVHLRVLRVREDGPEHIRIDSFTPESRGGGIWWSWSG